MLQHVITTSGIFVWFLLATSVCAFDSGLFPVVFNLAARADITANATCGQDGPEQFCKLVDHVKRQPLDKVQCGVCDATTGDSRDAHPVSNAIDGSNRWWQSPSIASGRQYNFVTITLDLKQIYQVAYVIVKAANSPRPGNWILERSLDGVTYTPWQYYAQSDSDCWNLYKIKPSRGIPEFNSDNDVICTSEYSKLDPLHNGEIHTSLINGRPGVDGPSQELLEFTRARYIRLRLQKIRTLNADFMTFIYNDPRDLDPSVTNRYYYSIKDIWVGGQCLCHGHASFCPQDPVTGELKCECEGNTCGNTCERCCPLFNQKPWKPASYQESAICEECNCFNHALACVYNETVAENHLSLSLWGEYEGGGVCSDCQHHTMGINCEMCEDGYYRPAGVAHYREDACHMCLCDGPGAMGLCVKDSSLEPEGIFAGDCICREGYCGPRCEECAPGYSGYPYCEPCPCDRAGSLNTDVCEGECVCKTLVEGIGCEMCSMGFYNLDWHNPDGCTPCFCFGITDQCYSSPWGTIKLTNMPGWVITDLAGTGEVTPNRTEEASLTVYSQYVTSLNRDIYWKAPEEFTGNILTSYGGILEYEFCYFIDITDETLQEEEPYLANYDVILEGGGMLLGYSGQYYEEGGIHLVVVNISEPGWHHVEGSTSPANTVVTREEFLTVLAWVDRLLIRATYHMYQTQSSLLSVCMDIGLEDALGPPLPSVEMCMCPPGYAGTSCEYCEMGYRRVDNILYGGQCVPCDCNGHSQYCDPFTGECMECDHNTQGTKCEECQEGYHGDPSLATEDCCELCACPLDQESNNFAQGCVLTPGTEHDYQCVGCQQGYVGMFCESCAPGYYGDPTEPGNSCKPCDCRGNVDPSEVDICDRMTGRCHQCLGNTEGFHCDTCQEGYYGVADDFGCRECACNPYGSESTVCDRSTGQCPCHPEYTGRDCAQCWPGYGNVALGCPTCNCSTKGSTNSECDPVSGQCQCLPGVGGLHCSKCLPGYYGYSNRGCTACQCNHQGAAGTGCDDISGQCGCKANVQGRRCDQCQFGYWGLEDGQGCHSCDCNITGSTSQDCDPRSGQCQCRSGVTGQHCDQCQQGYYGFSTWGCQRCDPCNLPGHVCDPLTGDCVCPALTQGERCETCQPDAWGYDPYYGCRACRCNSTGSWSTMCDPYSGQCDCKRSYSGRKCDQCHFGHYDFPRCKPCHCDQDGTRGEDCDDRGHCQCDQEGQCPCKENVVGKKCRSCQSGSFSLRWENPQGCTSCFCFGLSTECQQAQHVWQQLRIPDIQVTIVEGHSNALQPNAQGLLVIPLEVSTVVVAPRDRPRPLYVTLPNIITGDRTTSYAGMLSFSTSTSYSNGGDVSATTPTASLPLVHLQGNYVLNLYYYLEEGRVDGEEASTLPQERLQYDVDLREDLWFDQVGTPTTREDLMVALQNLQGVMVRVADSALVDSIQVRDISLDHAVPANGSTPTAYGVEECVCPPQYTGLSCQDPVEGHYRKRPDNFPDGPVPIIDLVGISVPCRCHGHSESCHRETGICNLCQHNTAGSHCELCAQGYYGDPTRGTPQDCQPCPCPFLPPDSFSKDCHVTPGGSIVCDRCIEGYIGEKCDKCDAGYYGDPSIRGQRCNPCDCNLEGSLSNGCDPITGQCACRPGVTGRSCDQCQPRHVLVEGSCQSCTVGCPGIIVQDLDRLNVTIREFDTSASAFIPWSRLLAADELFTTLHPKVRKISPLNLEEMKSDVREAERKARRLVDKSEYAKRKSETGDQEKQVTVGDSRGLLDSIQESDDILRGSVSKLEEQIRGRDPSGRQEDVDKLLEGAEEYLEEIKAASFTRPSSEAQDQLEMDQEKLEEVKRFAKDHETATEPTEEDVQDLTDRLQEEKNTLTSGVIGNTDNTTGTNVRSKRKMYSLRDQMKSVKDEENARKTELEKIRGTKEEATDLLWNISSSNFQASMDLLRELDRKKEDLNIKSGLLMQNLPGITEKVEEAEDYADELDRQSRQLEHLFSETRHASEDPVKAAKAFEDITTAIEEAETLAEEATKAAENSTESIAADSDDSLSEQAKESLRISKELEERSKKLQRQESSLEPRESKQQKAITAIEENNQNRRQALQAVETTLRNLTLGVDQSVRAIGQTANQSLVKSRAVSEKVTQVQQSMEDDLLPKLEGLKSLTLEGLTKTNAGVNAARAEFKKLLNLTESLSKKAASIEASRSALDSNLKDLQEKIKLARQQAKSIKLSLSHEGECIRRYEPEVESSTSNTIRLYFKTNQTTEQQSLFLLHDPESGDYLSVGLADQHVSFSWDVGGGSALIQHPLLIEPTIRSEQVWHKGFEREKIIFDREEKWYMVEADRIANVGKLRVNRLHQDDEVEERATFAPATHIKFDVAPNTRLFVGGLPQDYQLPGEVISTHFAGCLGEVSLDGKPVGLYNFRERQGQGCTGCFYVPIQTPFANIYQFDGSGYAQLDPERYSSDQFSLTLTFKTFYKDALLFFMANEQNGDYISLEMRGGQVVFQFSFQGKSTVYLHTAFDYNMNKWTTVSAKRLGRKGLLKVDGLTHIGEADDIGTDRLRLRHSKVHIGGVPPNYDMSRFDVVKMGFVGCFKDIDLNAWYLDLRSGLHVGMTQGCQQKPRVVGLDGKGYIELLSPDLPAEGDISFSFRTQQTNALLMLAIGKQDQNVFYSVSVHQGRVHAWFNGGAGLATIETDHTYNDGEFHSVGILKTGRLFELYVDDEYIDSAMLPAGSGDSTLALMGEYGGLYIGGLEYGVDADGMAASLQPLMGCLSDLVINGELLSLDQPLDHVDADIGRCDVSRIFPNLTSPETLEEKTTEFPSFTITVILPPTVTAPPGPDVDPGSCAEEGRYTRIKGSTSFGNVLHSHAEIIVQSRDVNKDFRISLEFRTYAPRGLIFYITNEDQTEYIAVQLVDGKVDISYAARGQSRTFASETPLHDGIWHVLKVTKDRKLITVELDNEEPQENEIRRKIDVIAPIYVGGLPDIYQPRQGLVSASFQGCMRNFDLNGEHVDLFNSKSVMGVSVCYTDVEKGIFFDGHALAMYAEEYYIVSDFKVSFSFRTIQQDAILLTTSSPSGEPALGLELYQGKLIFTAINSGGQFSTESDVCQHCLCDNQWHSLSAELIKNVVTLTIDGRKMKVGSSQSRTLNSEHELYIGGFPLSYARPQAALHTETFFRGCIKDLVINGTVVDWQLHVEDLYDIHVGACPVSLE